MRRFNKYIIAICAFVMLGLTCMALPSKPSPPRLVNDLAGMFTASQRAELEHVLVAFDDSTSNQITVVTVSDLEGYAPSDYATRLGISWQVGSGEFNNGVVVLVKPKTESGKGEVAIAVGYGLEGAIPDAYAKRIIENEMIPHFRNNDYYAGVAAACRELMKLASGEISEPREIDDEGNLFTSFITLMFIAFFVFLIIKGSKNDKGGGNNKGRRQMSDDELTRAIIIGNILGNAPRRSSGGFGGSSGGFGGGFGGFGGGSFGGGGASGSW